MEIRLKVVVCRLVRYFMLYHPDLMFFGCGTTRRDASRQGWPPSVFRLAKQCLKLSRKKLQSKTTRCEAYHSSFDIRAREEFSKMKLTPTLDEFSYYLLHVGGRKIDGPLKSVQKAKKNLSSPVFAYFYDICIWPLTKKVSDKIYFYKDADARQDCAASLLIRLEVLELRNPRNRVLQCAFKIVCYAKQQLLKKISFFSCPCNVILILMIQFFSN